MQVFILDEVAKREIADKLRKGLRNLGMSGNELEWTVEDGMDSRLCDLEEVIDINDLKTVNVI